MKLQLEIFISLAVILGIAHGWVVVCQHGSWSAYRNSPGNFTPSLMDPRLCTHGVYAFATLDRADRIVPGDYYVDMEGGSFLGGYKQFVALKQINPNFKAMIALGGSNGPTWQFSEIAANPQRRAVLIESVVEFLKLHKFDGLEFDWLYPWDTKQGDDFAILLSEMRQAFIPYNFVLTASVSGIYYRIPFYNLTSMQKSLDFMVMTTYEYNGPWYLRTAIHAPMHEVNYTTNEYLKRNVNSNKLVLSIPAFGHSYTLKNPANHGLGEAASGCGNAGPFTRTPGTLSFNEIYPLLSSWTVVRDETNQEPYAYKGDQWISYDDVEYTKHKIQYAKEKSLAGAAIWLVGDDYFFRGEYPLLRAMQK